MKNWLITHLIFLFSLTSFSQKLHTPKEVFEIMEKSELSYSLQSLDKELPAPDYSDRLNLNYSYIGDSAGVKKLKEYEFKPEIQGFWSEAEKSFSEKNYGQARKNYKNVIQLQPELYMAYVYIGQTYGIEKNWDSAIVYYQKVIDLNFIDYMAHWFLADAYMTIGKKKEALEEISIAHVLNRNNPRILSSLKKIFEGNKLSYSEFLFHPQTEIIYEGENEVTVKFNEEYTMYSLYRALWMYEPGYAESMGVSPDDKFSFLREKECLLGILTTMDTKSGKKMKKKPEFAALQKSLDLGMMDLYILYEIFLPQYPRFAYVISEDSIRAAASYVIKVRGGMK